MDEKKSKPGVSVKEIETFTKKHKFEVFFCLSLLLACFFTFVFFEGWGVVGAAGGGILGILFPDKVSETIRRFSVFFQKQEDLTQLIIGIAGWIISIFLPFAILFLVGVSGGERLQQIGKSSSHKE